MALGGPSLSCFEPSSAALNGYFDADILTVGHQEAEGSATDAGPTAGQFPGAAIGDDPTSGELYCAVLAPVCSTHRVVDRVPSRARPGSPAAVAVLSRGLEALHAL